MVFSGASSVTYASRWTATVGRIPNYQTLKLYRNYDGQHSTVRKHVNFRKHNADPNLFSIYAALFPAGTTLTLLVVNKDPANPAQVGFTLSNFTPSAFKAYTLSQAAPTSIVAGANQAWNATQNVCCVHCDPSRD